MPSGRRFVPALGLAAALIVLPPIPSAEGRPPATRTARKVRSAPSAPKTASTRPPHRRSAGRSAAAAKGSAGAQKAKGHKSKPKRSTAYTRLARMQMEPARVTSIQQALISAGAFHGEPTGRWDSGTRDAMARYQAANGFGVTGLPDAKSLMKLGLGPHPLPAELNKASATRPNAPETAPPTAPEAPSDKPATSAGAPPSSNDN